MKFSNVRDLKIKTTELLRQVGAGEEIVITYHGKPMAMLVRVTEDQLAVTGSAASMLKDPAAAALPYARQDRFLKLKGFIRTDEGDWSVKHDDYLYGAVRDPGVKYGKQRGRRKKS